MHNQIHIKFMRQRFKFQVTNQVHFFFNTVLVLPYINMNLPRVYTCPQSWTPLPPPSPYHPSGSSQCTSSKHPVSCIEPRLAIRFLHDIIHVSTPFSQIMPPSPSPTKSKILFYISVSLLLSHIQGYRYHLSKFHIYVLVYCIDVFLSGLLHSEPIIHTLILKILYCSKMLTVICIFFFLVEDLASCIAADWSGCLLLKVGVALEVPLKNKR